MSATVISDEVRTVPAVADGQTLLIDPGELGNALGWELQPRGLCRDDVCVPVRDEGALFTGGQLDLRAVARALGRLSVIDTGSAIAAVSASREWRREALHDLQAPSFTLDDLDGNPHMLDEWQGMKKLLLAFASW